MAGQARIVLFTWVRSLGALRGESRSVQLSTSTALPPLEKGQIVSPRPRSGLVGWRVIAANNREMGRGASPASGVVESYQAIYEIQLAFDRTESRFCADGTGSWAWQIVLGSEQVVVSSRAYPRQRECVYSLDQFREQFPTATVLMSHDLRPRSMIRGPLIVPSISAAGLPHPAVNGPTSGVAT